MKIKFVINPSDVENEVEKLNKIQVVDKNLHENKNDMIKKYTVDFETVGGLFFGDFTRNTHIRFRNNIDYEAYINSIDRK